MKARVQNRMVSIDEGCGFVPSSSSFTFTFFPLSN
jgi:hypothetical protein